MRQIKFRAWRPNKKSMQYFDFIKTPDVNEFGEGNWFIQHLMQFTGLHDKNGVDIYEGDLVKHLHHKDTFIVEWNEKGAGFIGVYSNGRDTLYKVDCGLYEVVGNIYEDKRS